MDEKRLSREEIALSILNGIIASQSKGDMGAIDAFSLDETNDQASWQDAQRREACMLAFQMADLFIGERDKGPDGQP